MLKVSSLRSQVHLQGHGGAVYLPLCCKVSFLALLNEHDGLLEEYIRHGLATTDGRRLLIFIADGDVMNEAVMATGTSSARAQRLTAAVSTQIRAQVDAVVTKIGDARIKGVVHWADVAAGCEFRTTLEKMEGIMYMACEDANSTAAAIQRHVKTLIKNLFTQRVNKARAAGSNITNVFTGDGLAMLSGKKYTERYRHLERACLLELCSIMVGLEHCAQKFTQMLYLTPDPQGMTHIAVCLQQVRHAIAKLPVSADAARLKATAAETHGITFVRITGSALTSCTSN